MQNSDNPPKIALPFAQAGGRATLPVASQIGITDGAASMTDGFPPLTRTPPAGGGIPPNGLEMNGILYLVSAGIWWQQAGGLPKWDSTYATAIGGYPADAVLQSADGSGAWRSTAENNASNPDAGGANWVPHHAYGQHALTMASSNVTLTSAQALKPQIAVTGTLVANVALILPAGYQSWIILNSTAGAFNLTAKTAAGTGVILAPGPNFVFSDGANILSATSADAAVSLERRGSFYVGNIPAGVQSASITYATPFPNGTTDVVISVKDENSICNVFTSWRGESADGFTLNYNESGSAVQDATIYYIARGF